MEIGGDRITELRNHNKTMKCPALSAKQLGISNRNFTILEGIKMFQLFYSQSSKEMVSDIRFW